MFSEVLNNIIGYDSKLWATLKYLFRPGRLALLYQEGKRKSFLHPVRLFLFLFVILAFLHSGSMDNLNFGASKGTQFSLDYSDDTEQSEGESMNANRENWSKVYVIESLDSACHIWIDNNRLDRFKNLDDAYYYYDLPDQWKYVVARKQIKFLIEPKAYGQFIEASLIWIFLLLQPLIALIFKLILWRYYFSDHLIWSLYLHSSMMAVMIGLSLFSIGAEMVGHGNMELSMFIMLVIGSVMFTYLSIRLYYKKSLFVSLLILLYLSIAYMLSITIAFIINLVLGFLLF